MISFYLIPMERSTLIMLLLLCMKCMAHRSRFVTRLQNRARPDQFVSGDNLLSQTKNINPTLIPQSLSVTARSDALRLASAAAAIFYLPTAAQAVKGAFELDAEYYLKALIGGDKKEQLLNRRSPLYVSPRKLDTTLANSVLECVLEAAQNLFGIRKEVILDAVSKSLPYSVKYFKLFAALGNEDVSDQYYFDMLLFLYYREIGQRIESSPDRVRLREKVGEEVLNLLLKERSVVINKLPLGPQSTTSPLSNGIERMLDLPVGTSQPVSAACANMPVFRASLKQILDKFTKSGLLSDYVFDDEDLGDVSYLASTFSEV